jgi:hypothetical protein
MDFIIDVGPEQRRRGLGCLLGATVLGVPADCLGVKGITPWGFESWEIGWAREHPAADR